MRALGALLAVVAVVVVAACTGDDPDLGTGTGTNGGAASANATIQCGNAKCAAGQVCCITKDESVVTSTTCMAEADCATGFFACDDAADCPSGRVCCTETHGHSVAWGPSACADKCDDEEEQLCTTQDECASKVCETTEPSVTPANLRRCKR